ncbi:hypothetical protein [Collimonas sp.]|jgi:hypothetical protein|uniref:hypothetical protein n=1 Tax=Collimonas sp. TaxID=1963772 RepID=UPI002BE36E4B|nr:hypothetical protein [Collimonas sp.]HWW07085.1 hypothetical protein [Collimonas sp.]
MHTVRFKGRVLPEIMKVTTTYNESIKWECLEAETSMEFNCGIANSLIDVECKIPEFRVDIYPEIYRRALDLSRAQVDLVAFKMGWGLTVVLETFVDPKGVSHPICHINKKLSSLCTSFGLDAGFGEICTLVTQSPQLFMALRELISSISLPHVSSVDAARAIERLKHLIATPGANDKQAWKEFREALQIDQKYLKYITNHSAKPRHGNPDFVSGEVTTELTYRSWAIMNRYFEYLKRGGVPLSSSEFPLLVAP